MRVLKVSPEVLSTAVVNYSCAIELTFAGAVEAGVNGDKQNPLKEYRGAW